eukprot:896874-Prorocentrum_minimum.AAC.4
MPALPASDWSAGVSAEPGWGSPPAPPAPWLAPSAPPSAAPSASISTPPGGGTGRRPTMASASLGSAEASGSDSFSLLFSEATWSFWSLLLLVFLLSLASFSGCFRLSHRRCVSSMRVCIASWEGVTAIATSARHAFGSTVSPGQ